VHQREQKRRISLPNFFAVAIGLLAATACSSDWTATPLPEPPALDGSRIRRPDITITFTGSIWIEGDAQSASAGATLRVTNLDSTDDPATITVANDGSFSLEVLAEPGDELRIDAVNRHGRSEPIDLIVDDELVPSPRHDCVRLAPKFSLEFRDGSRAEELTVHNLCAQEVALTDPRARLELADFTLESELPLTIATGESAALEFEFAESSPDAREDVFFIDIEVDGEPIRYPVTLYAPEER
jgi:hypothetical protein